MKRRFATSGGELAYVDEGDGPVVLLLHGFPELAYSWRKIMPTLAAAGFHGVSGYWHGIRNQDRSIQDDHPDDDQAATDTSGLIP